MSQGENPVLAGLGELLLKFDQRSPISNCLEGFYWFYFYHAGTCNPAFPEAANQLQWPQPRYITVMRVEAI